MFVYSLKATVTFFGLSPKELIKSLIKRQYTYLDNCRNDGHVIDGYTNKTEKHFDFSIYFLLLLFISLKK